MCTTCQSPWSVVVGHEHNTIEPALDVVIVHPIVELVRARLELRINHTARGIKASSVNACHVDEHLRHIANHARAWNCASNALLQLGVQLFQHHCHGLHLFCIIVVASRGRRRFETGSRCRGNAPCVSPWPWHRAVAWVPRYFLFSWPK